MPCQWTDETTQYPGFRVNFSVGNGTIDLDLAGPLIQDEQTAAAVASLCGQIKDALESASLIVGAIHMQGIAFQTLDEVV